MLKKWLSDEYKQLRAENNRRDYESTFRKIESIRQERQVSKHEYDDVIFLIDHIKQQIDSYTIANQAISIEVHGFIY